MERKLLVFALLPLLASCLPESTGTGTGGSSGNGTGGTSGGTGGTVAGVGGSGEGGSALGAGGSRGTGGMVGTDAGTDTGGGMTGTGGAPATNPVCDSVKGFLEGFEYLLKCGADQSYSVLVCQNPGPSVAGAEYLIQGTKNLDQKFTVAGTAAQSCTITLSVQGVVEPKHYQTGANRCTTYFGSAMEGFAQGPAAGGVTTGCYPTTSGNYNVYMMHVSDSATALTGTAVTGTRYYWNAINQNEEHFSYPINYTTPAITIKGGQTLWMLADDSNASAIKNCARGSTDSATAPPGLCNPITVPNIVTLPAKPIVQPYNGQFVLLHVTSAK